MSCLRSGSDANYSNDLLLFPDTGQMQERQSRASSEKPLRLEAATQVGKQMFRGKRECRDYDP